jgi:hypothetical protein
MSVPTANAIPWQPNVRFSPLTADASLRCGELRVCATTRHRVSPLPRAWAEVSDVVRSSDYPSIAAVRYIPRIDAMGQR